MERERKKKHKNLFVLFSAQFRNCLLVRERNAEESGRNVQVAEDSADRNMVIHEKNPSSRSHSAILPLLQLLRATIFSSLRNRVTSITKFTFHAQKRSIDRRHRRCYCWCWLLPVNESKGIIFIRSCRCCCCRFSYCRISLCARVRVVCGVCSTMPKTIDPGRIVQPPRR